MDVMDQGISSARLVPGAGANAEQDRVSALPELLVRNVSVTIGRLQILKCIDFHARAGKVSAIIGPNGSGKSTLLKAIIGEQAHSGSIHLAGLKVEGAAGQQMAQRRAVLAQHTPVAFPLSVHEVVALGLGVRAPEPGDYTIASALEAVDMAGFAGRSYLHLSGGEQQRVQLARVLCQIGKPVGKEGPRWLFLDEPVSSLDIRHQLWVMALARDFAQAGGGVVAVMHDLNLTALYADEVLALKAGRALAHGQARETLTGDLVSSLYDCNLKVGMVPAGDVPFVLPHTAQL